jgi:DNA-binding transcriptional MocR family regulator
MTRATNGGWTPRLADDGTPAYKAIANALEADILDGRLAPGDPLPTQRELAEVIGVNFTTVTRAYTEARRRGLLTATVGRGTFVAAPQSRAFDRHRAAEHDLSVNAPPVPVWLPGHFQETLASLATQRSVAQNVVTYASRTGDAAARELGTVWLRARGLDAPTQRIVVTSGAQHALAVLLASLAGPGETVLTEWLAYPGLRGAASMLGVRLVGVEVDDEGLDPERLDAACAKHQPKAIFCVPTLHNPTTAVMSLARRHAVVDVARRHGVRIVEDDICGPLEPDATPLAVLAPDLVSYIGSLSKCVAPGLRTAFVLEPTTADAARLGAAVRASMLMVAPMSLAVACAWIADGTALRAVNDIKAEAVARGRLAARLLGNARVTVPAGSIHAWLHLPSHWTLAAFVAEAQQRRVRVAPADWYAMPMPDRRAAVPSAVRITLGAEPERRDLEAALGTLAELLDQPIALSASTM